MKEIFNRLFGKNKKTASIKNICEKNNGEMRQYCKSELTDLRK